jgi:hypothetical protein
MDHLSATIAHIAAVPAIIKLKTSLFSLVTKHFVRHAFDAGTANVRSKTFDMRERPKEYFV